MRRTIVIGVLAVVVLLLIAQFSPSLVRGETKRLASPIFGVTIPDGYRDWKMIAVAHEAGLDELRGVLGNDVAVKAYQEGILPFPDGTILVKLAWKHVPVEGLDGAFVTGPATTVQVMVKDARKYASTGGWGFGRFIDGMPVDEMQHRSCVPCHEAHVKDHDLVFTKFAR
ncbi:cytochrome P460 family protein [Bradyrhizobium sp. dw_78]|uniref:cytochrome P460 family protein n=1 Tax=Bradyrhizobium sp. dw_78 TaxID=2719793 RepID=UPI001BD2537D|nr:cytochrome P460 family protein [Bradyrhizobium sp. dw_78]